MTCKDLPCQDRFVTVGETPSQRVARELRARLASDEWVSGDRLPTVERLSEEYHAARATVIKALKVLAGEELIVSVRGWGTFKA